MKKSFFSILFISLIFFAGSLKAQNPEVVYIRIIETPTFNNYMQVSGSDGSSKRVELEKIKFVSGSGTAENGVTISKQIKELIDQGYELKSHSTGGTEVITTTMIFIYKED